VVAVANWAGAYTTTLEGWHTVISSRDEHHQGPLAVEILFHEASHGMMKSIWARLHGVGVPSDKLHPEFWHALLFFSSGEIVKRTLERGGVAVGATYAERNGLYQRGFKPYLPILEKSWRPYLAGRLSWDAAFDAMLAQLSPKPAR
jgi:hypothetical protein